MRLRYWFLLLCVGCASSSEAPPEARSVRIASTFGEVAACEMLGSVDSSHATDEGAMAQMMSRTLALGGNVLYIKVVGVKPGKSGVAYRCAV
jgi:hypothetical protein